MKKILLSLVLIGLGVFIGYLCCSQFGNCKKQGNTTVTTLDATCAEQITDIISGDQTQATNEQINALLQECGGIICDPANEALLRQVEEVHKKEQTEYNQMLRDFWGPNPADIKYNDVKWTDIQPYLENHCYDEYITFYYSLSKTNDISLTNTKTFTQKPSCYSIPLFKSIALNHPLNSNTVFNFTKGKNKKGEIVILFEVDHAANFGAFYDISDVPLITDPKFVLFLKELLKQL